MALGEAYGHGQCQAGRASVAGTEKDREYRSAGKVPTVTQAPYRRVRIDG